MGTDRAILLDTDILVHFVRDSGLWKEINREISLLTIQPTPMLSLVTLGEIRSFSVYRNWGEKKRDQMEFAIRYFSIQTIENDAIMECYAVIDAY